MEPLSPRLRSLLGEAMREAAPRPGTRDRALHRMLATLSTPPPSGAGPTAITTGKVGGGVLKILLAVASIGGAATVGVAAGWPSSPEPPSRPLVETTSSPAHVDVPAVPRELAPAVAAPRTETAPAPSRPSGSAGAASVNPTEAPARAPRAASSIDDDLALETRWIASAHAALVRGDGQAALDLATRHAQRFPRGQLTLERQAVQLAARCMLDPAMRRAAEVEHFLRDHGDHAVARKVRAACLGAPHGEGE